MGTPKDSEKTRARIIEAAGRLFAEKGFNGVKVRDIAREAETHLGALNYHFQTKQVLYREVLMAACLDASISEKDQELLLQLEPRQALYTLIAESIKDYRRQTTSNWQSILLMRECLEPSDVFSEVVDAYFKPLTSFTAGLIGRIVDKPADDPRVQFAVIGLIALLDMFGEYEHLVDAVTPGLTEHLKKKNRLERQILDIVLEMASTSEDA